MILEADRSVRVYTGDRLMEEFQGALNSFQKDWLQLQVYLQLRYKPHSDNFFRKSTHHWLCHCTNSRRKRQVASVVLNIVETI